MIRRAWSATTAEGPLKDRFANALAARVGNEVEPPQGGSVELVENWLELVDAAYTAAGEPDTAAAVDAAADETDLSPLYDLMIDG